VAAPIHDTPFGGEIGDALMTGRLGTMGELVNLDGGGHVLVVGVFAEYVVLHLVVRGKSQLAIRALAGRVVHALIVPL
jgi:hypothetical protein